MCTVGRPPARRSQLPDQANRPADQGRKPLPAQFTFLRRLAGRVSHSGGGPGLRPGQDLTDRLVASCPGALVGVSEQPGRLVMRCGDDLPGVAARLRDDAGALGVHPVQEREDRIQLRLQRTGTVRRHPRARRRPRGTGGPEALEKITQLGQD
jgi:hypothetical protein